MFRPVCFYEVRKTLRREHCSLACIPTRLGNLQGKKKFCELLILLADVVTQVIARVVAREEGNDCERALVRRKNTVRRVFLLTCLSCDLLGFTVAMSSSEWRISRIRTVNAYCLDCVLILYSVLEKKDSRTDRSR